MVNRYHGTLTPPRIAPSRPFKEKTEVSLYPASAWLMDPSDFTKETAFNAGVSDFLKYLTANQQRVFIECFLKGQSYKEYAEENGIRAQSVQETAKYVKRKAKKFFKKF